MSVKSWIKEATIKTTKGKTLQRVLCSLMINNPVGLQAEFIPGIDNALADQISRVYSKPNSTIFFRSLTQEFLEILS